MAIGPKSRWLAALTHLVGPALSFLPGLALWFHAMNRDPWLEAHGRLAARFQLGALIGYLVLTPLALFSGPGALDQLLLPLLWITSFMVSIYNCWRATRGLMPDYFPLPKSLRRKEI